MSRTLMIALFALAAAGCGSKGPVLVPVSGKVLVNGKPAEHAIVVLHPVTASDQPKPRGTVATDGSFTLTTNVTGDGAPPGEYRVTVEQWLAGAKADDPPTSRLPAKYAKPETSGLTATVTDTATELKTIEIKR
jgi:predicted small lipoprotein YifL